VIKNLSRKINIKNCDKKRIADIHTKDATYISRKDATKQTIFFFLSQTLVVIAQTLATNYKSIKVPTIFKAAEIV